MNERNSRDLVNEERLIQIRHHNCTGFGIKRISPTNINDKKKRTKGKNARGKCVLCEADTRSFCVGCRRFLCDELRTGYIDENCEKKRHYISFGEGITSERTCFIIGHEEACKRLFQGKNKWTPFVGDIQSRDAVCRYISNYPETEQA